MAWARWRGARPLTGHGEHTWGCVAKTLVCDRCGVGGERPRHGVIVVVKARVHGRGGQGHDIEWRAAGSLGRRQGNSARENGVPSAPKRFSLQMSR